MVVDLADLYKPFTGTETLLFVEHRLVMVPNSIDAEYRFRGRLQVGRLQLAFGHTVHGKLLNAV